MQSNLLSNLIPKLLFKLPSISLNIAKPTTKSNNNSVLNVKDKPFNIFIISTAAYNYYLKNYKKEKIILFYTIYDSLAEAADNLLKDYTEITKIVTVYDDFIKEVTIPKEVIDRLPEEYYEFRNIFNRSKADKLPPYYEYNYKIKLTLKKVLSYNRLYPIFGYKL